MEVKYYFVKPVDFMNKKDIHAVPPGFSNLPLLVQVS